MRLLGLKLLLLSGCLPLAGAAPPSRVGYGAGESSPPGPTPVHAVYRLDAGASVASAIRGPPPPVDATVGYLLNHDPTADESSHGLFAEFGPRFYTSNHTTGWLTLRGVVFPDWEGTRHIGWGGFLRISGEFWTDVHAAGADSDKRSVFVAGATSGKLSPLGGFIESGFQRTTSEDEYAFVTSMGLSLRLPAFAGAALVAGDIRK